ncbi:MAG: hypothetical protein RL141_95 [Candidatus Parcubacteria bacterium]|jgi:hypothetical protein
MVETLESGYEVVIWDWDAAPDGGGFYVYKRFSVRSAQGGQSEVEYYVDEQSFVGGAVFKDGNELFGAGLVLGYPPKKV